jgi:phage portal protein BeeE
LDQHGGRYGRACEDTVQHVDDRRVKLRNPFKKQQAVSPELARALLNISEVAKENAKNKPYRHDMIWNYNVLTNPRRPPRSVLSIDQLKAFADNCDVLRSCILHLTREVWATKAAFSARDSEMDKAQAKAMIAKANEFFSDFGGPSGLGGMNRWRMHFEYEVVESLCVTGAAAVYLNRSVGGQLLSAECIEAATIRPVIDAYGYSAETPYEQWLMGVPCRKFKADELLYVGLFSQTNSPFFKSPIEWILMPLLMSMKSDEWNRSLLTDGETLRDIITVPESWTPQIIGAWLEMMTAVRKQNPRAPMIMPGGSTRQGTRTTMDKEFADLDMWLLRRICSLFGVQPASIGYVGEQYKVSQDASMSQTTQYGAAVMIEFRNSLYNWLLIQLGLGELECGTKQDEATETPVEKADRLVKLTGGKAILTVNEARSQEGLEPIEGGDELNPEPKPVEPNVPGKPDSSSDPKDDDETRLERAGVSIDWMPTPDRRKKAEAKFEAARKLLAGKGADLIKAFVEQSFDDGADVALDAFAKAYAQAVITAHSQAAQAGGILTGLPRVTAVEIGKDAGQEQKGFIEAMVEKIKPELLLPDADVQAVADRIQKVNHPLYVNGLTGTANEASVAAIPEGTEINWRLEPDVDNHCRDCPSLAAMGPYTPETLPCYPGDGFTECKTNCRCGLYLADGTFVSIHDWTNFAPDPGIEERAEDLRKWEKKAIKRLKDGKPALCSFESYSISHQEALSIGDALESARTAEDVKNAFRR